MPAFRLLRHGEATVNMMLHHGSSPIYRCDPPECSTHDLRQRQSTPTRAALPCCGGPLGFPSGPEGRAAEVQPSQRRAAAEVQLAQAVRHEGELDQAPAVAQVQVAQRRSGRQLQRQRLDAATVPRAQAPHRARLRVPACRQPTSWSYADGSTTTNALGSCASYLNCHTHTTHRGVVEVSAADLYVEV